MKCTKQEKAITLIALVITIILLLILAGVVVNLTLGEHGIINRTQESSLAYKEQEAREKLELVLLDLQADKVTYEKYDENDYIDTKIRDNGIEVEGDIAFVDGWKFEIDRSVPKIGENLGQGEIKVTVEALASYVGTSSSTINVTATSAEGNIVGYEYKLNGEVRETTTQSSYTIEDLEPTTTYKILVVAIDEAGNRRSSKAITITTKERTYIIKDGVQQVQGEVGNATISEENGYLNIVCSNTKDRAGCWYNYDLTNYKKVKADVDVPSKGYKSLCLLWIFKAAPLTSSSHSGLEYIAGDYGTEKERGTYSVGIKDLQGEYLISVLKNQTTPATAATMNIYNLWLEE